MKKMNEEKIEHAITYKGLNAPRVTPEHISGMCQNDQYYVFPETNATVCCITLFNGFTVIGESSCVSDENFDEEIGRNIAFENAKGKIWLLEGYLLNYKLKNEGEEDATEI